MSESMVMPGIGVCMLSVVINNYCCLRIQREALNGNEHGAAFN